MKSKRFQDYFKNSCFYSDYRIRGRGTRGLKVLGKEASRHFGHKVQYHK